MSRGGSNAPANSGHLSPIVLTVFNRPTHMQRTVEALKANELAADSDLIVYADGPRGPADLDGVNAVRALVHDIGGFRSVRVIERTSNMGLARNAINAISSTCSSYGSAIYLEDDNLTSRFFLRYLNEGLRLYGADERVASINAYVPAVDVPLPETFFLRGAETWGWGTWDRAWQRFNPDGRKLLRELRARKLRRMFDYNNSVDFSGMLLAQADGLIDAHTVRWYASAFLADMLTLYPRQSLVQNIGNDGSGVHSGPTHIYDVELATRPITVERIPVQECETARRAMERFNRKHALGISPIRRIRRYVRDGIPPGLLRVYRQLRHRGMRGTHQ